MQWDEFYNNYFDWADSTLRSRISSLTEIGSGHDVVDVLWDLPTVKHQEQFIRKAMKLGVRFNDDELIEVLENLSSDELKEKLIDESISQGLKFSTDNFEQLEWHVSKEIYRHVCYKLGHDPNVAYIDEDNLTWDDFYNNFYDWDESVVLHRISILKHFGDPDEVFECIQCMPSERTMKELEKTAKFHGVNFSKEQNYALIFGDSDYDFEDELDDEFVSHKTKFSVNVYHHNDSGKRTTHNESGTAIWKVLGGIFAVIAAVFGGILYVIFDLAAEYGGYDRPKYRTRKTSAKRKKNHCDGDCANCPPHYGYRYGRWYYGHDHVYGCQFGGNRGSGSMD